jgi:hypothetical protein
MRIGISREGDFMTVKTVNRRQILAMAAAGTLLGSRAARAAAGALADWAAPDFVVLNARIYTMDPQQPRAEAFAVKDGRFAALGSTLAIKALAGKGETIDAQQMTIVPGFIDSHNHAPGNELLYEVLVGNPYEVEFVTIASIIDKLRVKAQQTPADTWVEGYFFDDTKVKDKRALTRQDLDHVSTQLPVMVQHRGGHTAFYNSKALQMAGIKQDTPNPAGGTFDRDANGELTGAGCIHRRRQAHDLFRRRSHATRSGWARVYFQAVRALRAYQRLPRSRQSAGVAAGARPGRAVAPGEL